MNCNVLFESTHDPFILDKLKHYIKSDGQALACKMCGWFDLHLLLTGDKISFTFHLIQFK